MWRAHIVMFNKTNSWVSGEHDDSVIEAWVREDRARRPKCFLIVLPDLVVWQNDRRPEIQIYRKE